MTCVDQKFWTEVSYLVTLLVATAISILNFRRISVDEKVKQVTERFQTENSELNKLFDNVFMTNAHSKKVAIAWIISERIVEARKNSLKKFEKDRPKVLKCIEKISQRYLEKAAIVSFILFLGILLVFFSQSWFDPLLDSYVYGLVFTVLYSVCIFTFLVYVWPWTKYTLLIIEFLLILPMLLLPIFGALKVLSSILGFIGLYFSCSYFGLLKDTLSKPKLSDMSYICEMMKWCTKLTLLFYLPIVCFIPNTGTCIPIFCMKNQEIKKLLFNLAPLNIFIYFLINIIILYIVFAQYLESYLKKVFTFCVLENFQPKLKEEHNNLLENLAKQEDYLNRLQIFFASGIDGLLLRKIQVDHEEKYIK